MCTLASESIYEERRSGVSGTLGEAASNGHIITVTVLPTHIHNQNHAYGRHQISRPMRLVAPHNLVFHLYLYLHLFLCLHLHLHLHLHYLVNYGEKW